MKNYRVTYYYSEMYCIHDTKHFVIIPYDREPSEEEALDYMEEHEIEPCRYIVEIERITEV